MGRQFPLDPHLVRIYGLRNTESRLRRILGSVKFELLAQETALRICGPDLSYHKADPYLLQELAGITGDMPMSGIASYRSVKDLYDLCFEDCWSGYFIADQLRRYHSQEDLVLVHLDHHTDMMPTLLSRVESGLCDPVSGNRFNPMVQKDWESAICTGSITIGNYLTPIYYSGHKLHIRHINNYTTSTYRQYNVIWDSRCYRLIPGMNFAAIRKKLSDWQRSVGSYLGGQSADEVLQEIPPGRMIVHIDLDYFINDFNGNIGGNCFRSHSEARDEASRKLERFFDALSKVTTDIDRWIIATSPGFCSARHWNWLLGRIEDNITQFQAPEKGVVGECKRSETGF